jgi:hypothetical protein
LFCVLFSGVVFCLGEIGGREGGCFANIIVEIRGLFSKLMHKGNLSKIVYIQRTLLRKFSANYILTAKIDTVLFNHYNKLRRKPILM